MPEGVTYWTGVWDPDREALSKQVRELRNTLSPTAPIVSISTGQRTALHSSQRVIQLSGRHWPALRLLAPVLERRGRVTHVFGEMHAWHLLRSVGRRPVVFTVAIPGEPLPEPLLDKVAVFVAESTPIARSLEAAGVGRERVRVVYPGVDLERFRPAEAARRARFTVLFASSPSSPSHFEARGIPLLVEAARRVPEIDILLLWRRWGRADALKRALADLKPPPNVISEWRDVEDMAGLYQSVHAVAFPVAPGYGKSAPNSVIEALACGCPGIVSDSCGIADVIAGSGAGLSLPRNADAVADALRTVHADFGCRSAAARALALRHFDRNAFLDEYRDVYRIAEAGR